MGKKGRNEGDVWDGAKMGDVRKGSCGLEKTKVQCIAETCEVQYTLTRLILHIY